MLMVVTAVIVVLAVTVAVAMAVTVAVAMAVTVAIALAVTVTMAEKSTMSVGEMSVVCTTARAINCHATVTVTLAVAMRNLLRCVCVVSGALVDVASLVCRQVYMRESCSLVTVAVAVTVTMAVAEVLGVVIVSLGRNWGFQLWQIFGGSV